MSVVRLVLIAVPSPKFHENVMDATMLEVYGGVMLATKRISIFAGKVKESNTSGCCTYTAVGGSENDKNYSSKYCAFQQ